LKEAKSSMPGTHNRQDLKEFRKHLRNNCTPEESALWKHLKGKKLGDKFRRQHSVGSYVLDFYCATKRLAIELDGQPHFTQEGINHDLERAKYLESHNIKIVRFENVRVLEDIEGVLKEIKRALDRV
jgi:very-short-patch-repair endonuclease